MAGDIESRMDFIIEQQAQFTVDMQALKERQAEALRMIESNTGMIRQLVDVGMSLARHAEETDRLIRNLRDAQADSDRRLDALIDTVDKLVRRNGS
jgi:ABC-type transporter Mla subunit MlaD